MYQLKGPSNSKPKVEYHKYILPLFYNKKNGNIEAMDSNSDAYKKLINDIKSVNELEKLILEKSLNLPTTGNFIAELALTFESIVKNNLKQ
jgi:hypothetical protein